MHFAWETTNICIVVRQWHVRSILGLVVSLLAVTTICAGYEGLRQAIRRFKTSTHRRAEIVGGKRLDALLGLDRLLTVAPSLPSGRSHARMPSQDTIVDAILYTLERVYALTIM